MSYSILVKKARRLMNAIENNYLELGKVLAQIYTECQYTEISFKKTVARDLGISYRKAMYLIGAWGLVDEGLVNRQRALRIGWYKLGVLRGQLSHDVKNNEYWLNLAEKSNTGTLRATIMERKEGDRYVFKFQLNETEYAAVESALMEFGAMRHGTGLRNKERALFAMLVKANAVDLDKRSLRVVARAA